MSLIAITVGETVEVLSPYNASFVGGAKRLGGRWDPEHKLWRFAPTLEAEVRALCAKIFGAGEDALLADVCTVRITADYSAMVECGPIIYRGRVVAAASDRDGGARPGPDVSLISGKIGSGGSMKYWKTTIDEGTVLEVRNVPRAAAEDTQLFSVEIVEDEAATRRALEAERERLAQRLAEIDDLLAA